MPFPFARGRFEVEDQATAQFMTVFYRHIAQGEGKAEALRHAQLEMLHSGAPPYFWAGYELDGEPGGSPFRQTGNEIASRSSR